MVLSLCHREPEYIPPVGRDIVCTKCHRRGRSGRLGLGNIHASFLSSVYRKRSLSPSSHTLENPNHPARPLSTQTQLSSHILRTHISLFYCNIVAVTYTWYSMKICVVYKVQMR